MAPMVFIAAASIVHLGLLGCRDREKGQGTNGSEAGGGNAGESSGGTSGSSGSGGAPEGGTSGMSGSSGTGGTSEGGMGGAGGSSGAVSGGSSGVSASGGSSGAGGRAGMGGTGGNAGQGGTNAGGLGGSSSASCPATEPPPFDAGQMDNKVLCDDVGAVCRYGNDCCACNRYSGCGDEPFWFCVSPQAGCPAAPPTPGSNCTTQGMACTYCTEMGVSFQLCNQGTWAGRNVLGCT